MQEKKPHGYKIVCISLFQEDINRLDRLVKLFKERGKRRASKSKVIREALRQIDMNELKNCP